jgi:hypothetical protein
VFNYRLAGPLDKIIAVKVSTAGKVEVDLGEIFVFVYGTVTRNRYRRVKFYQQHSNVYSAGQSIF